MDICSLNFLCQELKVNAKHSSHKEHLNECVQTWWALKYKSDLPHFETDTDDQTLKLHRRQKLDMSEFLRCTITYTEGTVLVLYTQICDF